MNVKYVEAMAYVMEIKRITEELLEYILSDENRNFGIAEDSFESNLMYRCINNTLPELDKLLQENPFLFENESFISEIRNRTFVVLGEVSSFQKKNINPSRLIDYINMLSPLLKVIKDINVAKNAWDNTNQIIDSELRPLINKVQEELSDIKRAKLTLQNDAVYSVFLTYETKLRNEADLWENRFFIAFAAGATIIAGITIIPFFTNLEELNLSLWFLKLLFLSVTITLSTYFLRRSIHLRKQADQMGQFSFELDALPSFMSSLDKEKGDDVTLKLIDKYFGREIDQSQNDKIGDMLQEQVKAGTELIRASAEMVKSVKPNNQNAEN